MNRLSAQTLPFIILIAPTFYLFGQYLLGPPNIYSARTLVNLGELIIICLWLLNTPQLLFFRQGPKWTVMAFIAWQLSGWVSVALSEHFYASFFRQLEWLLHGVCFIALVDCFIRQSKLIYWYLASALLLLTMTLAWYGWRWYLMEAPHQFNWFWGSSPYLNIRHMAFAAVCAFGVALYGLTHATIFYRSWGSVLFVISLTLVIWGGGRASMLACLTMLILACLNTSSRRQLALMSVPLIVLAAYLSTVFAVNHQGMGFSLNHQNDASNVSELSSGRWYIWTQALSLLKQHWWFGLGPDLYIFTPGRIDETVHPHSLIIQILLEWGILGSVGFIIYLVTPQLSYWLRQLRRQQADTNQKRATLFILLAGQMVLALVDGNFYHAWATYLNLAGLAFIYADGITSQVRTSATELPTLPSLSTPRWLAYPTLLVGVIVMLQTLHLRTTLTTIPHPSHWRAIFVQLFPYQTIFVDRWLGPWSTVQPEQAGKLLDWLQVYSPHAWKYHLYEARLWQSQGDTEKYKQSLQRCLALAPKKMGKQLLQELALINTGERDQGKLPPLTLSPTN